MISFMTSGRHDTLSRFIYTKNKLAGLLLEYKKQILYSCPYKAIGIQGYKVQASRSIPGSVKSFGKRFSSTTLFRSIHSPTELSTAATCLLNLHFE